MTTLQTVEQLSGDIKGLFNSLGYISVRGELSNVRCSKGHHWFELLHLDHPRDSHTSSKNTQTFRSKRSKIGGVVWNNSVTLSTPMEDGQIVVIDAKFQCFGGKYYLNTQSFVLDQDYRQATAQKLYQELYQKYTPLFERPKKQIPTYPKYIGLVTGSGSDALHDVINISYRRDPTLHWIISPSLVQGKNAHNSIIEAVNRLINLERIPDVIVLARGGGSTEDLWTFNEPSLIEFLAKLEVPIVTGIGHQMDVTLTDHIADLRMSTPSAAAEKLALPLSQSLEHYNQQIITRLKQCVNKLSTYQLTPLPPDPIKKAYTTLDIAKRQWTSALFCINTLIQRTLDKIPSPPSPPVLPPGTCQVTRFGRPFTRFQKLKNGDRLRLHVYDTDKNTTQTIYVKVTLNS